MTKFEIIVSLTNLIHNWNERAQLNGSTYDEGYDDALGHCADQLELLVRKIHGS